MRKVKAVIIGLFLFSMTCVPHVRAQGYPVIDIANLFQAITTLYATYDEITQMIEQVQNTYKQLEKQGNMIKNMNWDKVGESIQNMDLKSLEGFIALRDQIKDVTYYVNRNMNLINNLEDTLTKKTISFGGKKYTMGGLLGIGESASPGTTIFDLPKNLSDYVEETAHEAMAGYEGKLTYAQKEAIMQQWGLSPRNYAKVRLVEENLNYFTGMLFETAQRENYKMILEQLWENHNVVSAMMEAADESLNNQMQATTHAILGLGTSLARMENGINNLGGFLAVKQITEQQKERVDAEMKLLRAKDRERERRKWSEYQSWF
jgi:hypothetical protein